LGYFQITDTRRKIVVDRKLKKPFKARNIISNILYMIFFNVLFSLFCAPKKEAMFCCWKLRMFDILQLDKEIFSEKFILTELHDFEPNINEQLRQNILLMTIQINFFHLFFTRFAKFDRQPPRGTHWVMLMRSFIRKMSFKNGCFSHVSQLKKNIGKKCLN